MIDRGKHPILGIYIHAVDYEAALEKIMQAAHNQRAYSVTALAVHGIMTGVQDRQQRYRLNHFDLIVPDGMPVRWSLDFLHQTQLPDRVYGPSLMEKICKRAEEESLALFFYGSHESILRKLKVNLMKRFPKLKIVGIQPSQFRTITAEEKAEIIREIRSSSADLVFVGLGCPRQEVWAYEYRNDLSIPIVAVGAAFDFLAENIPQAPVYLQNMGLEWLFRLYQEPRRLWRRYLLLNPYYLALFFLQVLGIKRFDPSGEEPHQPVNYG